MIRFLQRIIAKLRNLSLIFILVYKKKLNIGFFFLKKKKKKKKKLQKDVFLRNF
jgi:hypothetical protein